MATTAYITTSDVKPSKCWFCDINCVNKKSSLFEFFSKWKQTDAGRTMREETHDAFGQNGVKPPVREDKLCCGKQLEAHTNWARWGSGFSSLSQFWPCILKDKKASAIKPWSEVKYSTSDKMVQVYCIYRVPFGKIYISYMYPMYRLICLAFVLTWLSYVFVFCL